MELFTMMMGSGGQTWIQGALLVGLFWAVLAHPDRIRSVAEFRLATLLLGISMIVPVLLQLFLFGNPINAVRQPVLQQHGNTSMYTLAIPPALLMLAVLFAVDSVTPRARSRAE